MARKKIEKQDDVLLTEKEVNYVLAFSSALMNGSIYGNAINPMMLNQRMKDITLSPLKATETSLNDALKDPKNSEILLQEFSQNFEIESQLYKRLLSYLGNMLSFDLTYVCNNIKESGEYKSSAYKKDLDIVKGFFDKFDYRKEFTTVVHELLRNEAYFCCTRFEGNQYLLQELPASPTYTMITGRWDYGLLFSFSMLWFINPGVDINMYPLFFKEKYTEVFKGMNKEGYIASLSPEARGSNYWVYWQDIDVNTGWCFKFLPEIATRVPVLTAMFLELIQQDFQRALQKNINMANAAKIVMGEVPTLKDTQAKPKDNFTISADYLGKFLAFVKAAIGESIKAAAIPLNNIKGIEFSSNNDMYKSYLKNVVASSGVNSNLIFTSDTKMNAIESQLSVNVDEQWLYSLYPQFEMFLNYQINKLTKKYKFNFKFEGSKFFNNYQQRFDNQMALVDKGIVLPQEIAASLGMNPFEFERQLEEARELGFVDKLTPILSSFQMSPKADAGGRPTKSTTKIGEDGEETRSSGGNLGRGGKI